jgi:hypothetical protein
MGERIIEYMPKTIDWSNVTYLDNGAFGMVFDLKDGTVVKVSVYLPPDEAQTQQYFYDKHDMALPVLLYQESFKVPDYVSQMYCPEHGPYKVGYKVDFVKYFSSKQFGHYTGCTCGKPLSILHMPKADLTGDDVYDQVDLEMLADFEEKLVDICENQLEREWDQETRHVALWNNHIVALDFGRVSLADEAWKS